jgi:glycolate oxidase
VAHETVHELIKAARNNLSRNAFDYLVGGAEGEATLRRNRMGYDAIALRAFVLRNAETIDLTRAFLGHRLRIPVMLAPLGSLHSLHPDGALAQAEGAERFGTISILSAMSYPGFEEIAKATRHPKIYQLNVRGDRDWLDAQVERTMALGYAAFCFMVDTAKFGRRERDIAKRYRSPIPPPPSPRYEHYTAALSWDDVKRVRDKFAIPLIVKGIATAEDADRCATLGVDAVYVSNHGGRQLDQGRGSIEALPEVVRAVGGRCRVVVDGGIARGTDVLKALCLGADAVAVGRLCGYGLAADGADGVVRVLEILEAEMRIAMTSLRLTALDALGAHCIRAAEPNAPAHVFSAFPHLDIDLGTY